MSPENPKCYFHFNDKYGAGLADAAAAVALAGAWTNLRTSKITNHNHQCHGAHRSQCHGNPHFLSQRHQPPDGTCHLGAGPSPDIPKGDLTITLTSPSPGNTTSTFCKPHTDTLNQFTNWKFMTVRNWAESSNGTWTLTDHEQWLDDRQPHRCRAGRLRHRNHSRQPAARRDALDFRHPRRDFLEYHAERHGDRPDCQRNNGKHQQGPVFQTINGSSTQIGGNLTAAPYSTVWNTADLTAGNYTLTAVATDSEGASGTSKSVTVQLEKALIAGWDFQTPAQSPVPLTPPALLQCPHLQGELRHRQWHALPERHQWIKPVGCLRW
jgi:hypothetical protein